MPFLRGYGGGLKPRNACACDDNLPFDLGFGEAIIAPFALPSCPQEGLTVQVTAASRNNRARQTWQAMQGIISSCRFHMILLGSAGSAICGRHISQMSSLPSMIACSGISGVNSRYAIATRIFSAFLVLSRDIQPAAHGDVAGDHQSSDSCQPTVTLK